MLLPRLKLALAAGIGVAAYARFGRPWVLDWGATPEEARRVMPGDDLLDRAAVQTTRAITIDAPVEAIWPWLLQMGPRPRAGVYTYDWLERALGLDIENSDRIMPEHQHLVPGDIWTINGATGLIVRDVQDLHAIVLQWTPARTTWTFALYPDGACTRLVSRNRLPYSGPMFWPMAAVMEPASLIMEREMLLGIKRRAEGLHRSREQAVSHA